MTDHHPKADVARVFIACSAEYRNRKALVEALGSIFLDTIEGRREYYYFECPVINEIFDDGVFGRSAFRRFVSGNATDATAIKSLKITHIVAGGDDAFVTSLVSDLEAPNAALVRLV
ncbi:hypothetical protein [Hyphomicrobium sp. 99]|uniref:hypothetical protein n=1 Tax=Hyphomicrobium sp. 99 TaxID=1163419 RepID=UPI0005F7B5C8|nr:hypothetical protein [Hyphomicrobium sp. 99]